MKTESVIKSLFDEGKETRMGFMRPRGSMKKGSTLSLEIAIRYATSRADFAAQHGTVRVLVKDGKPVEPQP